MADRGEVKVREGKIQDLISFYHGSYKRLTQELISASTAGKIQKARTMARIRVILQDLGDNVEEYVRKEIPQYYLDGANAAMQDLRKLGVDVEGGITLIDRQAIAALVDEVNTNFAESITVIGRSATRVLTGAQKQQIQMTIAEGKLTGAAVKTIAAGVKEQLISQGLTGMVDRGGRQWSFDNYAEMLVRTKAVESRNQGLANKMLASGHDLVQVSDHNSDHPACAAWEGKILSITGNTKGYPTVAQATAAGLFHPNCKHAINVINPELAQKTKAYINPETAKKDKAKIKKELSKETSRQTTEVDIEQAINAGDFVKARAIVNALPDSSVYKASHLSLLDMLSPETATATSIADLAKAAPSVTEDKIRSLFSTDKYTGTQANINKQVLKTYSGTMLDTAGYIQRYNWSLEYMPIADIKMFAPADEFKVAQYVEDFKKGAKFPAPLVTQEFGNLNLLDGSHRLEALKQIGGSSAPVLVGKPK